MTLSCLKCSTMDQWLKLKFLKHHQIRISTFMLVFSASKCHLSPTLRIVIGKLVYFEISLIVASDSFLFEVFNYGPMAKTEVSKTSRNRNMDFLDCI